MSADRPGGRPWRRAFAIAALLVALTGDAAPARAARRASPPAAKLEIGKGERLLVVAPHPDDESIAAAGLVQRVLARGGAVDVVLVTAGDGYPDGVRGALGGAPAVAADYVAYGTTRIGEARAALATLASQRAGRLRLTVLGFPDGALAPLRTTNASSVSPARSPTTGASDPPYDALVAAADAPYAGEVLRREVAAVITAVRPTIVALPDPLDTHPDHSATGLFVLDALGDTRSGSDASVTPAPRLLAYLVHWPDWPAGWDATAPEPSAERTPLVPPNDLPERSGRVVLELTDAEIDAKRAALAHHATQQRQMPLYLAAFVRRSEPFTRLPAP